MPSVEKMNHCSSLLRHRQLMTGCLALGRTDPHLYVVASGSAGSTYAFKSTTCRMQCCRASCLLRSACSLITCHESPTIDASLIQKQKKERKLHEPRSPAVQYYQCKMHSISLKFTPFTNVLLFALFSYDEGSCCFFLVGGGPQGSSIFSSICARTLPTLSFCATA